MEDDYWNSSSVTKIASRQGIFDTDGSNAIDVSLSKIFNNLIFSLLV